MAIAEENASTLDSNNLFLKTRSKAETGMFVTRPN